jgi:catechol 2,3-dioxygenase-like lactoylglutathione lyase family enzyme
MIHGFDHVSLPMQHTDAMVAFYRSLGLTVAEHPHVVSVYVGDQMINLHRPETWQREGFTLRGPAAQPSCGDLCFVWEGSPESLQALLREAGAEIIKIFPSEGLGPGFVKAVRSPLPQAQLMPTGGVSLDNVADWIKAGCIAVGVSGHLTGYGNARDSNLIIDTAKQFLTKIRQARA